ncbi:hypothetical protein EVAR_88774_1 [Eumeta japonica]|uniref:Uncharacterized protein n=1 Tax=Eumeta variegata TaxID=151549 RepID=A0A4C1XTJ3_EUMVA|nr:hypothetical protein EVAR_88774_1 [Eumeta japonica]
MAAARKVRRPPPAARRPLRAADRGSAQGKTETGISTAIAIDGGARQWDQNCRQRIKSCPRSELTAYPVEKMKTLRICPCERNRGHI